MQHSHPTLAFKPFIPLLPILFLLPLLLHHRLLLLVFLLRLLLPLLRLFNGMLAVFEPGALNCYIFFCPILYLICIQESNLNPSSLFRIPGFSTLRSDCTHSRPGILSRDATHASGGVVIFVRQSLFFSELSTSSVHLISTLIM